MDGKRLSMSELANLYTKIEYDPISKRYFGKCPFCHTDVRSFFADNETSTFYCYACGAAGNRKKFEERMGTNVSGLIYTDGDPILLKIYKDAALFYYAQLVKGNNPGFSYFANRGLTHTDLTSYGLGFAPDSFACLYGVLKPRYQEKDLMRSGLFKVSKNGNIYDLFRNRVMFPILNEKKQVIAFGGRVLDDTKPKYINSPESPLFSKKERLYGYPYEAKDRREGIIICEGYMDYIAVHSAGYKDCAAVLGTALTEEHARLIASHYKRVYLSMDSDGSGIYAAKRSVSILEEYGLCVQVLDFSPHKDPDEFIRKNPYGVNGFEKRIKHALPAAQFLARNAADMSEFVDILVKQVS